LEVKLSKNRGLYFFVEIIPFFNLNKNYSFLFFIKKTKIYKESVSK